MHREELAARNAQKALEPWLADMKLYVRKLGYRKEGHPSVANPWRLTLDEYEQLVTSPCYYCGTLPNQRPHGVALQRAGVLRNGIDRIDNAKGYEPQNCVPCCRSCNWEKGAQTQVEFIENTRRRYEFLAATDRLPREIAR